MDTLINLFNSILPISKEENLLIKEHLIKESLLKGESYHEKGKVCRKLGFVKEGVFKVSNFDTNAEGY